MKIHKTATYILIITGALHGLLSFQSLNIASPAVYIFGFISLLCIIGSMIVFYKKKQLGSKWVLCHRLLCVFALLTVILHIYLFINGMIG